MLKLVVGLGLTIFCGVVGATGLEALVAPVISWLGPVGTAAAAGATAAVGASKLFGGNAPSMQKPTAMPTADDEQVKAAKRRQIAEMQARSGRASTVLSDDGAKLGG